MEIESHNYINYRYFSVRFDPAGKTFEVRHEKYGVVLENIEFEARARDLNHVCATARLDGYAAVSCFHEKHLDGNCLAVALSGGPDALPAVTVRVSLDNYGARFALDATLNDDYKYEFTGTARWGGNPAEDTFSMSSVKRARGLRSAFGPASSPNNDMLFNRKNDAALKFIGQSPNLYYDWQAGAYKFRVKLGLGRGMSFGLTAEENALADKFALRYKCINKNGVFKTPPAGFMTWYALMWGTNERRLLDNVAVQAEKLKPYGADTVWVDFEWYHNDNHAGNERCDTFTPDPQKYPNGLKAVADGIKKAGFVPAVWIAATHDVSENRYLAENPEILFLKKRSWCGDYFFDPTHPKFLNEFLPLVFKQILDWGYRAVKWDALPLSLDYYDQYHDRLYDKSLTSEQALRGAAAKAREILGEDVYMLSCHGEASRDITFAADIFDAARVGGDVFSWGHFLESCVERVYKYYPMHNAAQYVDPDNVVIRAEFNTMEQAKSRVAFVALLGLPVTFGDDLTALPDERMEILKRAVPALDIHPMDFEGAVLEKDYTLLNLFVEKPFDRYQAAGVFNVSGRALKFTLPVSDLDLDENEDYLFYDYWNNRFEGCIRCDLDIALGTHETKVFAVRKRLPRPQLVSTSRHISQGAPDILEMNWDEADLTLSGVSEMVPGDGYRLYIHVPRNYRIAGHTVSDDGILCYAPPGGKGKKAVWKFVFERKGL
jgi:hypothetical protein